MFNFNVLLTLHLSIFILVINQHAEAWNKIIVKQNFVHQVG